MKSKAIAKMVIDISMTFLLMLLMAFELIGRTAHEWIGMGMFALFVAHHILNGSWTKNLFRGKYPPVRVLQTVLAVLVFLTMLGSVVSAVLISREVFAFLPISGGRSLGRTLHLLCAYWGFVLLSVHLGIHWNRIVGHSGKALPHAFPPEGDCTADSGCHDCRLRHLRFIPQRNSQLPVFANAVCLFRF